jgi:hypothetical protein
MNDARSAQNDILLLPKRLAQADWRCFPRRVLSAFGEFGHPCLGDF